MTGSDGNKFWRPGSAEAPGDIYSRHLGSGFLRPVNNVLEVGHSNPSIPVAQTHHPSYQHCTRFLYLLETRSTVLVTGATGSGKTTQLPQYLAAAGWASRDGSIAVVLPTRVAVLAAAARVAQNYRIAPDDIGGAKVGYVLPMQVRRGPETEIVFFSSSALLATIRDDPLLLGFAVVMVDDAHERSISTDVLCGMLRVIQKRRRSLRIVLSTASLRSLGDFVSFYGGSNAVAILHITGRSFPVRVFYARSPVPDYLEAALAIVRESYSRWVERGRKASSDVLVFVPGSDQTIALCEMIGEWAAVSAVDRSRRRPSRDGSWKRRKRRRGDGSEGWNAAHRRGGEEQFENGEDDDEPTQASADVYAVPLFASLPATAQLKALEPAGAGKLKVVVATNVAELSLTIPGVFTVVDCGLETLKVYNPSTQSLGFATVPISQSSATQRAGRAGRSQAGECFRLYTKEHFETCLAPETPPEILRGDISEALLMLQSVGVRDVARFEFVAPPSVDALAGAMARLHSLGAVRADGQLTDKIGARLADFPLPPYLGRAVLAGEQRGVGRLVAAACAMLQVCRSVFVGRDGTGLRSQDAARSAFAVAEGDVITLLNVHRRYVSSQKSSEWCQKHGLSASALAHAHKLYQRLVDRLRGGRVDPESLAEDAGKSLATRVCRCVAAGLFANLCRVEPDRQSYRIVLSGLRGAVIHPSSVLVGRAPEWVVAAEIVTTNRVYLHNVTVVEPLWLASDVPIFEKLS